MDVLIAALSRALVRLAVDAEKLDDLLEPRGHCVGESSGRPPSRRGSAPPLSVSILDLKRDTEQLLTYWCKFLARADITQGGIASGLPLPAYADWLRARIDCLRDYPWGRICAEEIIAQARVVSDVVMPPAREHEPEPLEMGTAREMAAWSRLLHRPVSRSTIQRAVKAGAIPHELAPDGRVLVRLADVLGLWPQTLRVEVGQQEC